MVLQSSGALGHLFCSSQQALGSSRTALASGSPCFLTHTVTALSRTPEIRPKSSVGTLEMAEKHPYMLAHKVCSLQSTNVL